MYSSLQSIHEPLDLRNSSYWLKKRMISFLFGGGVCDLWSDFAALTACCLLFLQVSVSVNGSVMILSCYIFCQLPPAPWTIVSDSYTCVLDYSTSLESDGCSPNTYSIVSDCYTCVLDNSTFLESDSCSPKHPVPLSLTVILVWSGFWLLPLSLTVIVYLCVLDFGYINTLFHCLWQLHLCDLDFGYSQHHIPVSLTVTLVCFGIQLLPTPYSIVSDSYTYVFWIAAPPWGRTATLPVPSLWHQTAPICGCTKLWLMPDYCSQSPRVPGQMMWAVHTL